jgi:DNA-binding transcriptional LysR family regulator
MPDHLQAMRVFAQVVDSKSFSAAGGKLGMSKSLVSRHVSALEKSLSVKLLNRSTRKLSVTDAGALLYEHCARIVQEVELAEQRLTHAQSEPAGVVKITSVTAFGVRHVVPALAEMRLRYPKIQVQLSCNNRTLDPPDEGFDLGIRIARKLPPHLVARKLAANRAVLCAAPSYLERHGTPLRVADLEKHECVVLPVIAPKGVWTLRRSERTSPVQVASSLETDEMEAVHVAVAAGLGIGIVPLYMASDGLKRGTLRAVLSEYEVGDAESGIYLVYPPNPTLPSRVRATIDFLVQRFDPVPTWEDELPSQP